MKKLLFLILMAMALAALSTAQTIVTGDVSGVVTYPTGATVANAKVMLTNDATAEIQTAKSSGTADFRFPLLRPGTYTLNASAPGFPETTQKVTANLGQVSSVK